MPSKRQRMLVMRVEVEFDPDEFAGAGGEPYRRAVREALRHAADEEVARHGSASADETINMASAMSLGDMRSRIVVPMASRPMAEYLSSPTPPESPTITTMTFETRRGVRPSAGSPLPSLARERDRASRSPAPQGGRIVTSGAISQLSVDPARQPLDRRTVATANRDAVSRLVPSPYSGDDIRDLATEAGRRGIIELSNALTAEAHALEVVAPPNASLSPAWNRVQRMLNLAGIGGSWRMPSERFSDDEYARAFSAHNSGDAWVPVTGCGCGYCERARSAPERGQGLAPTIVIEEDCGCAVCRRARAHLDLMLGRVGPLWGVEAFAQAILASWSEAQGAGVASIRNRFRSDIRMGVSVAGALSIAVRGAFGPGYMSVFNDTQAACEIAFGMALGSLDRLAAETGADLPAITAAASNAYAEISVMGSSASRAQPGSGEGGMLVPTWVADELVRSMNGEVGALLQVSSETTDYMPQVPPGSTPAMRVSPRSMEMRISNPPQPAPTEGLIPGDVIAPPPAPMREAPNPPPTPSGRRGRRSN